MKKIIVIVNTILVFGLSFSGCSDQFLEDMSPYDKYSPQKTFGNDVNIDKYIQNLYYNYFRVSGMTPTQSYGLVGKYEDMTAYTEEKWGIGNKFNADKDMKQASEADTYFGTTLSSTVANNPYTRIRNCNEALDGIEKYGSTLTPNIATQSKGQVYFLRALQLYDLVRVYGGVPIVTKVLDAIDYEGAKTYTRSTVEDCFSQIVADLDSAYTLLPTRTEWGDAQYGRLTKEAALAYKSRVLLVFASPIFNSDWDNSSNQRWKDALKATQDAKDLLDAQGYGLYGTTAKMWDEMFYNFDNKWNKEVIMVKMMSNTTSNSDEHSGWQKAIRLKTMGGSGAGYQVPMGMLSIFPMADGKEATTANGYDEFLFFKNRDPRFYYTFTFSGMKWGYDSDADAVVWNYRWSDDSYKFHYYAGSIGGSSPAIVRKMSDPKEVSANTYLADGTDIYEYRYAELLLNLAECYAATGDAASAVKTIGLIRARVGIPVGDGTYGLGSISNKNEAIKACLRERQIELAYEGKRFWDLWRWMLYNDDAGSNNTTCAALGLTPLNGTYRLGKYLQVKGSGFTSADPMTNKIATFTPIDVNTSTDLQADMNSLANFWSTNFELKDRETPVDNLNNQQAYITWRQNYYLSGLPTDVLKMNTWLPQSIGWLDFYGTAGTYDARK